MKYGTFIAALILSWLITFWAVAVCISVSVAYREDAQKNHDAASPQKSLVITASGDGRSQHEATYKGDNESDKDFLISKVAPISIAVITAIVLVFQVVINRGQLKTQRDELRAYVSFTPTLQIPHDGIEYRMNFECTNHGKTPALDLGFRGGIWCVDGSDESIPTIAQGFDEKRCDIFPEASVTVHSNTRSVFTEMDMLQVHAGQKAFVAGLRIKYRDVFGITHETQRFFRNIGPTKQWYELPGGSNIT